MRTIHLRVVGSITKGEKSLCELNPAKNCIQKTVTCTLKKVLGPYINYVDLPKRDKYPKFTHINQVVHKGGGGQNIQKQPT